MQVCCLVRIKLYSNHSSQLQLRQNQHADLLSPMLGPDHIYLKQKEDVYVIFLSPNIFQLVYILFLGDLWHLEPTRKYYMNYT
jgi:hypothetical protein